jgi:hypothetical protein
MVTRYGERWKEEEIMMAMELFLRRGVIAEDDPEVQELARIFERTADAVVLKMANLQWVQTEGKKGMKNKSSTDLQVWNRYQNRPRGLLEETRMLRKALPWLKS